MMDSSVTEADRFVDMPATSQALYLHLYMHADNDGFVESANGVRRMCGATPDDLTVLAAKGFVFLWPDGVCLVAHWRVGNKLADSRKFKSKYAERLQCFEETPVGEYRKMAGQGPDSYAVATPSLPDSYAVAPRREEKRIEEERTEKEKVKRKSRPRFVPPTTGEVRAYCAEKGYQVDADAFVDFYESKGWVVGRSPMRSWQAACRTWAARAPKAASAWHGRTFDYEEVTVPDDGPR